MRRSAHKLRVAFAADLHFFPASLAGGYNQAFRDDNYDKGKPAEQSQGVLLSALAALRARAKRGELDYLVIAGDLTRDGEYEAHVQLARLLEAFQRDSGVQVLVIPGNHDLNNPDAAEYNSGEKKPARQTTPADFLEIYKNLGYHLPNCKRYEHSCSYAVDLNENYRLIAIDDCKYTNGRAVVDGEITPAHMRWIVRECAAARAAGKTVVGVGHHNLTEHLGYQAATFKGYLLDDYLRARETLADAGMQFYFDGHFHMGDIARAVSDSGSLLYDICVPALYAFPSELQHVTFTRGGKTASAEIQTFPADEALPVTAAGKTYAQPYYRENFHLTFNGARGGGLTGFLQANVKSHLTPRLREIQKMGGLRAYLRTVGVDVGRPLLSALCAQLDHRYINDPAHTVNLICGLLEDALALPLSGLPCARFCDTLGVGHKKRPGTLEDFLEASLAMIYWNGDGLSLKDDAFFRDVRRRIRDGSFVDQMLRFVIDKVVDDLLAKELLPQLKLRLGRRTRRETKLALRAALGMAVDLRRRRTISKSLDWLMVQALLGQRERRAATIVHSGKVPVPAGESDFRCPMDLRVELNEDKTGATVTWYTKASVTASDVLVFDEGMHPVRGLRVTGRVAREPYLAQKLDLGFIEILGQEISAARHSVTIEGLAPGNYTILAGDARRQWLSAETPLRAGDAPLAQQLWHACRTTANVALRLFYSFRLVK